MAKNKFIKKHVERYKIIAQIWAMLGVAAFASGFFEGHYVLGFILGACAARFSLLYTEKWVNLEDD